MHRNVTETALAFVNRQSKLNVTLASIALVFVLGWVDIGTGLEVHLHFLYVLSIALASWFVNRRAGIYIAILCDIVVLAADVIGGRQYSASWILYWNFLMRGGLFVFVASALSQLRLKFETLSELAGRDMLTGLPNVRAFYDLTSREIENASSLQPLSLAFVDIDGLKWINQRLGYATGDQLLCMIAQTIKQNVPRPELVGRVGGTAFAVLLPNVTSQDASAIFEKIQKHLKEERRKYAQPVTFNISAIACPRAPRNMAELMHEAESRMTRMKGSSKDTIEIAQVDTLPALN
jgi:diguanylate cyclase (GGDEF)-like protein